MEGFKQTLLAAKAVAYIDPASGGTSGIYVSGLVDRLGIGAEVKRKAVLVHGGTSADRVVSGEAEVAVQQISELLPVKGVVLVGPLPPEIQNYTVYSAGIAAGTRLGAVSPGPDRSGAKPSWRRGDQEQGDGTDRSDVADEITEAQE